MRHKDLSRAQAVVVALVVLHAFAGLILIGRQGLTGDEPFTAQAVRQPVGALLDMLTRIDVNMSFYYLTLKAWTSLFGVSEIALRLPSLIMTTATVALAATLLTRWASPKAGAICALALGLNPMLLAIGLTARAFALYAFLSLASLWMFTRALGDRRMAPWVALALIDVAAVYTSLLAALVIISQAVYLVAVDRRFRRGQLVAAIIGAVGVLPAFVFLAPSDTLNWIAAPTLGGALRTTWIATGRQAGVPIALLALAGLVLRPALPALAPHPRSWWLLPTFVVTPGAVVLVLLPFQSLLDPSYLVFVLVAAAMLAAVTASRLSPGWSVSAAAALAATGVLGLALGPAASPTLSRQDWEAASQRLTQAVASGDAVVFPNTFYRNNGEYFARRGASTDFAAVATPRLPDVAWFSQPPDTYDALKRTGYYQDPARVLTGVADENRIFLVGPDDDWMAAFTRTLAGHSWLVDSDTRVPGLLVREMTRRT